MMRMETAVKPEDYFEELGEKERASINSG